MGNVINRASDGEGVRNVINRASDRSICFVSVQFPTPLNINILKEIYVFFIILKEIN